MSIAYVRNPGEGKDFHYYKNLIEQVVSNAETNGAVTVMRLTVDSADAPPLHTHSHEDESWVILSGRVRFWTGAESLDECDVRDAEPGAYVFVSRSVPHTFQTITPTAEVLVINNPGAVEGYFHSIGAGDARSDSEHLDVLSQYGLRLLDDPPPARD